MSRATIGRTPIATGDLHLTPDAAGAIDMGTALADVTTDIDELRGATPDLGADERSPA